jgi:transcriptional regulator
MIRWLKPGLENELTHPMYIPSAFAESDLDKLHDFIESHSFAVFVSDVDGTPFATHLPLLLDRTTAPHGALMGHMARANPHWRQAQQKPALAIFSGPHVYISPTWYEAEHVVPTWNYTAVHVYGAVHVVEDEPSILAIVEQMVRVYERNMPQPWSFSASDASAKRHLSQIVGFRMPIDKIEGKWKLNQNQPIERRRKVVQVLSQRNDNDSHAVAEMMRAMLPADD